MLKPFAVLAKHTETVLAAQMLINGASLSKNIVPMCLPSVSAPIV